MRVQSDQSLNDNFTSHLMFYNRRRNEERQTSTWTTASEQAHRVSKHEALCDTKLEIVLGGDELRPWSGLSPQHTEGKKEDNRAAADIPVALSDNNSFWNYIYGAEDLV